MATECGLCLARAITRIDFPPGLGGIRPSKLAHAEPKYRGHRGRIDAVAAIGQYPTRHLCHSVGKRTECRELAIGEQVREARKAKLRGREPACVVRLVNFTGAV